MQVESCVNFSMKKIKIRRYYTLEYDKELRLSLGTAVNLKNFFFGKPIRRNSHSQCCGKSS